MTGATDDTRWERQRYLYILAQILLVGLIAAFAGVVLEWLAPVLMPVLLALFIAYVVDPLIDWFEAHRVRRTIAILFVIAVLVLGTAALVMIILPVFVKQSREVLERLPAWWDGMYGRWSAFAQTELGYSSDELHDSVRAVVTRAQASAVGVLSRLGHQVNALLNALLVPIFVFYFLRDFDRIKKKPLVLVPPRHRDFVLSLARRIDLMVGHWVRGQAEVALIMAVLYSAGLTLAGVRLGAVIGLVTGLLNVVPYFGVAIGLVLSVLMVLINGGGVAQLASVAAVFIVIQMLEGYVLTPRLVGSRVGLSPVSVIVVLLVGGSLFGLLGLLLAVPVTAALGVLVGDGLEYYQRTAFYRAAPSTPSAGSVMERAEETP